ncbi:hypothetical protein KAR91_31375 [Candidatus Pacearchaeota archaeon]|nr:hypothetical protein [Candidatus Pacearchaeota archaeon]
MPELKGVVAAESLIKKLLKIAKPSLEIINGKYNLFTGEAGADKIMVSFGEKDNPGDKKS